MHSKRLYLHGRLQHSPERAVVADMLRDVLGLNDGELGEHRHIDAPSGGGDVVLHTKFRGEPEMKDGSPDSQLHKQMMDGYRAEMKKHYLNREIKFV